MKEVKKSAGFGSWPAATNMSCRGWVQCSWAEGSAQGAVWSMWPRGLWRAPGVSVGGQREWGQDHSVTQALFKTGYSKNLSFSILKSETALNKSRISPVFVRIGLGCK